MYQKLLEPLNFYTTEGQSKHAELAEQHFQTLLTRSKIDVAANRRTSAAYRTEQGLADSVGNSLKGMKVLRVFMIILAALGGLVAMIGAANTSVAAILIGMLMTAVGLTVLFAVVQRKIKELKSQHDVHKKKADKLLAEAEKQVEPLNALFRNDDSLRLIEKTLPEALSFLYEMEDRHRALLRSERKLLTGSENERSLIGLLPGDLMGNPFTYCRRLIHRMGSETYHGSLVISWTETVEDRDGRTRVVHRTQTLHASVTRPKPFYHTETHLLYGNQAAPDLFFSRDPGHAERLSERQLEREIRSGKKDLEKKAQKALNSGKSFQEMSNAEFDVLFDATNRSHEVQFRLMYTPLAQQNTVALLRSRAGYGDDFRFVKAGRLNLIRSEHNQKKPLILGTQDYFSYDADLIRTRFLCANKEYFRSVYFDLAPLLSVPAYLEEPAHFLGDPYESPSRFSPYEHELMANLIGDGELAHKDTETPAILKTDFKGRRGDVDLVTVNAYSYSTESHLTFVPVRGGDGDFHDVPVHWVEYIPLKKTSQIEIAPYDGMPNGSVVGYGMSSFGTKKSAESF